LALTEHGFTPTIRRILRDYFGEEGDGIYRISELLQYVNIKTVSASRGSKARSSFGNLYALYVLIEDYVSGGYVESNAYSAYEGARFSVLLSRQRELPFGEKLQNHALNHRLNQEFAKYFPTCEFPPIVRNPETQRYWINERLLRVPDSAGEERNIAPAIIAIIDAYISVKRGAFEAFIADCQRLQEIGQQDAQAVTDFVRGLLRPDVDARIFEIVSFAVLKAYYAGQSIFWGSTIDDLCEEYIVLYKTGRCNANDGGIDFVMRPLGRFFQVTETMDAHKYFLDIDKVERFPLTFVVKSLDSIADITSRIEEQARRIYVIDEIVARYMACIEEIVNIPLLLERLENTAHEGRLDAILNEIVLQSRVEFNIEDDE